MSRARPGTRALPAGRVAAFVALAVVCCIGIGAVLVSLTDPRTQPAAGDVAPPAADDLASVREGAHVTFRSTALGPTYGTAVLATVDDSGRSSTTVHPTGLTCDRVAEAADRGLCLVADRGALTAYRAVVFDDRYQPVATIDLPGEPSRARISPDGRYGAATVFVSGHSYAQVGFSTSTVIIDLRTGTSLGDLEQFELRRDGALVDAADRNYWGVTFAADGTTFYATVATGGEHLLVRGDLPTRTMTTVRADVECPSLSPDGTRIAFKQRRTGPFGQVEWGLGVLDLATGAVVSTTETRSIDDQPAWLDDDTLLYGLARADEATPTTDVWSVPADGSGAPERFAEAASSPTVNGLTPGG